MAILERVDFYIDGEKIGQDLTEPFSYDWTAAGVGDHTCFARAVFDDESYIDSPTRTFSVTAADTGGGGTDPEPTGDNLVFGHEAEAVYYPKLINPDYTGNWIQVTEDSDGVTTHEIGFDSNGNPDTAAIPTGKMRISKYYDQSGKGRDWTWDVHVARPFIQDGGLQNINSIPAIYASNPLYTLATNISGIGLTTEITVLKDGSSQNSTVSSGVNAPNYSGLAMEGSSADIFSNNAGNPSMRINGSPYTGASAGDLWTALKDDTVKVVTTEDLDLSAWTGYQLRRENSTYSAFQFTGGKILFKGQLTTSEIEAVEAEVQSLFGVA